MPKGARPTLVVNHERTFNFAGTKIEVENFGPGHTDGDLWVYFKKADVLALGDTFWNGIYPYIDNEDGGNIAGAIKWANKAVERTTDHTIVIPGHGAVGTRTQLIEFRDMLVTVRKNVAALKQQGKSLKEIIAAKPTAAFDAKFGNFVFNGDQFAQMVYAGLESRANVFSNSLSHRPRRGSRFPPPGGLLRQWICNALSLTLRTE